ncbi:sigma-70 family RNA polymerase sigma factor [Kibdelosporangium phytohabitans]|uniref:sigma-70 family RNA polymerase sigma factor n=1 Tax=Kibdelosporangium phytohabitans TaxID=860235 RepID=UPI0019E4E41D|nr:sigma-70 family RNA polymerase sigma factor [Kibdelosporangium phytohabitans]MBE1465275.1 RNA polymerase sigma-70 factor (ECF subfamily) [Kibdelosporangium phytohabitans]
MGHVAYQELGVSLMPYALRLTGYDRHWAEDVVQETLIRAWRNAGRLDPRPHLLRAWVCTVARRVVIDDRRSRQARPYEVEEAHEDYVSVPDPADQAVSAMIVHRALDGLPRAQREVIQETYLRGRTVNEVADMLGVPPGTVKSRMYHGVRALRRALSDRAT